MKVLLQPKAYEILSISNKLLLKLYYNLNTRQHQPATDK